MTTTVFHPDVYRTDLKPRSYWQATAKVRAAVPLEGARSTEVAIIGGGYAGLSAALHLARDCGIEAVVLEARDYGWGASGRNGGFATIPATKLSLADMIRRYGEGETRAFHAMQQRGLDTVRALIADEAIACDVQGDGNYEVAHSPAVVDDLKAAVEAWRQFGFEGEFLSREAFLEVGHAGTEQFGAMRFPGHFGLHPMKYLGGLREAAERHGATLYAQSPVIGWEKSGGLHVLRTPGGEVSARHVILCTNGYTPDGLRKDFDNRTVPALSNIIVTRPLTPEELAAEGWKTECTLTNARDLLFYYRLLPDRRILFGARGGTSGSPTEDMRMKAWLTRRLGEVFPSWADVDVEYFWNGLVCLTGRLTPAIGRLDDDPTVSYGFGWHGSGVVGGTIAGRLLAEALSEGVATPLRFPKPVLGLPPNLFHPLVRRFGLKAAYVWYAYRDWRAGRD
ncbi:NAD(P)/FAD-dependent oxidoreductase [Oryzibacter oryziterrae]|uniref:NAD(P)/FAD-dependent oxidoreductase n=1 Tax=Oryzibacter oryziterrae TaxID=2766474 RepID=UPI001F1C8E5C|nr:FAD-dependent oxidoreductase [Oryzibacter oryziterrae]